MLNDLLSHLHSHALNTSEGAISTPEQRPAPPRAHVGRHHSPPALPTVPMPGPFLICGPIADKSSLAPLMLQHGVRQIVELREIPDGAADRSVLHRQADPMAFVLGNQRLQMIERMLSDPEVAQMPVRRLIVEEDVADRSRPGGAGLARPLCEARCVTLPCSPERYPTACELVEAARIVLEARQSSPDSRTLVVGLRGLCRPALVAAAIDLMALADRQRPSMRQEDFVRAVDQQLLAVRERLPENERTISMAMSRLLQGMWPLMQPAAATTPQGARRTAPQGAGATAP